MRDVERCLVCGGGTFRTRLASTFEGSWEDAVPYFLTGRRRAVHGRIVRCEDCGFVFTSPQFEPADYRRIYARIPAAVGEDAAVRHRRLAARVRRHVGGGRFLDLGSGAGSFLRAMDGYEGIGFDLRERPAAGDDVGVVVGDFLDWCADGADGAAGRLDFVTAWDVLEHLPDLDAYMEALANLLEPGGHLFCTVPNQASPAARVFGRRWNCYLLEHLWYFTPATLRRYLERRGFRIVELATISYPVVLGTILERVRQTYGTPMPRLPRPLARLVLPLPIGLMFAACRRDA